MELDKELEDIDSKDNEDLAKIKNKIEEVVNNEVIRKELLGTVRNQIKKISSLKNQNDELIHEIERDLSRL